MEKLKRALAVSLSFALFSPSLAWADKAPTEAQMNEARQRYDRGMKLYNEGAFDAALVEMTRAYELAPSYKILYNLGLIHKQLNDFAAALKSFRRYLDEGGKKVPKDKRTEVSGYVAELEKRVATVTVEVDVAGAEVSVDDAAVGTSPLSEPIRVNAGKRRITAKIAGKPAASRVITVAGTDTTTVKLELGEPKPATTAPVETATTSKEPTATTTTTTAATTTTKPAAPEKREVPWALWGITGGLAVATGVTGVLALSASSSLKDQKDTPGASREDLESASRKAKTWAIVSDVFLVGTVAMAGVSLYVTLKQPSTKDTASGPARGGLRAFVAPNGIALVGSF
jgi:hypothetical protein